MKEREMARNEGELEQVILREESILHTEATPPATDLEMSHSAPLD